MLALAFPTNGGRAMGLNTSGLELFGALITEGRMTPLAIIPTFNPQAYRSPGRRPGHEPGPRYMFAL
jgi:hypothetical protein